MSYLCRVSKEIQHHWFPIMNLSNFASRRYIGKDGGNDDGFGNHVCPYCMGKFSRPKAKNGLSPEGYSKARGKEVPQCFNKGDTEKDEDDDGVSTCGKFSAKFLEHVSTCQFNTITDIKIPGDDKNVMEFQNFGNLHHNR